MSTNNFLLNHVQRSCVQRVDWTATTPRSQQVIIIEEHSALFIMYLSFSFTELLNEELRDWCS